METVRLALCGHGLVGQRHVVAARQVEGVSLSAVVEPSAAQRAAAVEAGLEAYDDLDTLLAGARPDGVILATPTPLHRADALTALAHGIPTLIEKPIAATSDDARQIVAASARHGVPVLVGHHRRHNPLIRTAKEIIASGRIGAVRAVQATCWFYKPDSYFDAAPWRKQPGAGPVSVNLVHDVDLIRHLCSDAVSVSARAAPSRRGYANEDIAAAVLELANGAVATISVSDSTVAPWSWEMTSGEYPVYPKTEESCYLIGGSHGALSIPDLKVWHHDAGRQDWWSAIAAEVAAHEAADPLVTQIRHFRDVIRGKVAPLVSAEEGWRSLRVVEAIQLSAAQGGRPVTLTGTASPV